MALSLRALSRSCLRASAGGPSAGAASAVRSRALHSLPNLPPALRAPEFGKGANNASADQACLPLFSRQALDLIWHHWQAGQLQRLNDLVRGTQFEYSSLVETVIGSASNPSQILIFNTASKALNNAFFLHGLKPKDLGTAPDMTWDRLPQPEPPLPLLHAIEAQWGSFAAFKDAFSATATGMSASGWLWLVRDQQGNLGIVPTHGAGTVLVQNRVQKQLGAHFAASIATDAQGNPLQSAQEQSAQKAQQQRKAPPQPQQPRQPQQQAQQQPPFGSPAAPGAPRSFSSSAIAPMIDAAAQRRHGAQPNEARIGELLQPLLCLSLHEHAWLPDHGMLGQEQYLRLFWECVNWQRVSSLWSAAGGEGLDVE